MELTKYDTTKKRMPGYTVNNKIKLIKGGRDYFDLLLQLIGGATESIHLQSYIFDDDETGRQVADALMVAAGKNVQVYLLVDGYASQIMSRHFINELKAAGIHFRFFEPLFKSHYFYFGRRMHHKIFVADAKFALVGGINIANRYNDMPGKLAWLDFALYVEGEVARDLCVLSWKTWNGFPVKMGLTPCERMPVSSMADSQQECRVAMRRNDWIRHKNEISATYIDLFRKARSQITILCSYFLPGKIIRRVLGDATSRGVRIKVIIAGPSDIMLAKRAERWMYDWLLRHKIELYEYQPAILHAKIATCDGELLTIGSYNLNNISAYASIELNLAVRNAGFVSGVQQALDTIIQRDCIAITPEKHKKSKNVFVQFARWVSYQFIRVVFYMLTFYYKQNKK